MNYIKKEEDTEDSTIGLPKPKETSEPVADIDAIIANIMRKQIAQ